MFKKLLALSITISLTLSSALQAMVPLLIAGVSDLGAYGCACKVFKKATRVERILNNEQEIGNIQDMIKGFGSFKIFPIDNNRVRITEEKCDIFDRFIWAIGFAGFSAITLIMIFKGNKILKSLKLKR